jgi:uncharacterized protein YjbJ (UPF0337 family)
LTIGDAQRGKRTSQEEKGMFKSSRRNKAEGRLDKVGGWILEMVGRVTGRPSQQIKGKAARKRGAFRTQAGRAKERAGR